MLASAAVSTFQITTLLVQADVPISAPTTTRALPPSPTMATAPSPSAAITSVQLPGTTYLFDDATTGREHNEEEINSAATHLQSPHPRAFRGLSPSRTTTPRIDVKDNLPTGRTNVAGVSTGHSGGAGPGVSTAIHVGSHVNTLFSRKKDEEENPKKSLCNKIRRCC